MNIFGKIRTSVSMKLELPFAIFLLAAGCLLWFAGGAIYTQPTNSDEKTLKTNVLRDKDDSTTRPEPPIRLASSEILSQQEEIQDDSTPDLSKSQSLLDQSAANIVASPPIESTVLLTIDLFDQHLVTEGKYIQLGQGSRKSRLDFEQKHEGGGRLTQICDGRFFYSIHESDEGKNLRFADLYQLAKADQQGLLANPTAWMATGGLSSLLQHLAQAFDFEPVTQGEIDGVPTVVLQGSWNLNYLKRLTEDLVDPTYLESPVQWDKLPPQLPHRVELHLGADDFLPLFPYRIVFSQYTADNKTARPIVQFEMNEVSKLETVDQQWFVVQSGESNQIDLTEELAARVRFISKSIRTAKRNRNPKVNK